MFNKHSVQAVAYLSVAFGGISACVGSLFLGLGVVLFLAMPMSGYCFFMGLIHTAKHFSLIKSEEVEDQNWKLKPS